MWQKFRALPGRTKLFVVLAILLPVLALAGVLRSDRDVQINSDRAIELARPHIDFEPVNEDARLFRQGGRLQPVWAVSFSIPLEGSSRQFERLTTVELDAHTGEVIRVSVDNFDELEETGG